MFTNTIMTAEELLWKCNNEVLTEDGWEHEHASSVDADGTCLECGAINLI